jgi:hypothetical protein
MLMTRSTIIFAALALFLAGPPAAVSARAETNAAPRLKLIFVERFRFEAWDNAENLDDTAADGRAYTRNRTTLGLGWRPAKNLEVLGKVSNEFRVYLSPKDRAFNGHEIFVDNLCVKWTVPGRLPFTVTAGRQDINLGEGFVIADGTPGDGSRSYYFNALRLDADIGGRHRLTFFAHAQKETDRFLPLINPRSQPLAEQPERALALYYAGALGRTTFDAYAVHKTTDANEAWPVPARIDTLGARAVVQLAKPLAGTIEAAFQAGRLGEAGRSAYGAIVHLDGDLQGTLPLLKTAVVGGILLSGDDPTTSRMEGWDPIFSRWPKWSESYIYTLTRESRSAYWSNLTSLYAALALDFGARSDGLVMIQSLGACRVQPGEFPGGTGRSRGLMVKGRLNYKLSKFLSGGVIWEHLAPGSFYFAGASSYNWLQFEMIFRY